MKRSIKLAILAGVAAVLLSGSVQTNAQGNFDPAEFRQRQMDRYKEMLGVTKDEEWKVIEPRIDKVLEARRATQAFNTGGFGFGRGGGRRGGGGDGGGDGGGRRGRGGFGQPNPTVEALQQAIESNASADELKQKLAKFREERAAKEAELSKAQDELKKVLSVKQEAVAATLGLVQ